MEDNRHYITTTINCLQGHCRKCLHENAFGLRSLHPEGFETAQGVTHIFLLYFLKQFTALNAHCKGK